MDGGTLASADGTGAVYLRMDDGGGARYYAERDGEWEPIPSDTLVVHPGGPPGSMGLHVGVRDLPWRDPDGDP